MASVSRELASIGRHFYARGWALGTSGNYSAVVSRKPLRLAITSSGLNKRELAPAQIIECDEAGRAIGRRPSTPLRAGGTPSAETQLHVESRGAEAPARSCTRIPFGARCSLNAMLADAASA
ncbi:MAG TPA: class II aldolase/adducin family protein [Vicinamibacterales bacterium]|nr:class II aldolase/adducin family protein [Vicinamibacterales bacterium]